MLKKEKLFWWFSCLAVVITATNCGFSPATIAPGRVLVVAAPTVMPSTSVLTSTEDIAYIDAAGLDIAERRVVDVYQRVAPSVVSITTQVLRQSFFFDVVPEEASGSGFVLDTQGHILTNNHVIEGAQDI